MFKILPFPFFKKGKKIFIELKPPVRHVSMSYCQSSLSILSKVFFFPDHPQLINISNFFLNLLQQNFSIPQEIFCQLCPQHES